MQIAVVIGDDSRADVYLRQAGGKQRGRRRRRIALCGKSRPAADAEEFGGFYGNKVRTNAKRWCIAAKLPKYAVTPR